MKKTIVLLFMLCLCIAHAQPYFQASYAYPGAILSSAKVVKTPAIAGHLMAGYEPVFGPNNYNFIILKTDPNGGFSPGSKPISLKYTVSRASQCPQNGNWSIVSKCEGVTAIETNQPAYPYAVAGTNQFGCWFATLDKNGFLVNMKEFKFPTPQPNNGKPLLIQSSSNPNTYFIVGTWKKTIYTLQIDNLGNILWQKTWGFPGSLLLKPSAIIEAGSGSTGPPELIIAGTIIWSSTQGDDGFVMKQDAISGTLLSFKMYDWVPPKSLSRDEGFQDIKQLGKSPNQTYAVCGWTNNNSVGTGWLLELDNAGNILWKTFYGPNSWQFPPGFGVPALVSRVNSSAQNEFHVASFASFAGLQICKFDKNGVPFSSGNNETYHYDPSQAVSASAVAMDIEDNGSTQAITAYGDVNRSSPGAFLLVRACFNGVTGCEHTAKTINYSQNDPINISNPTPLVDPYQLTPNDCITLHWAPIVVTPNWCSFSPGVPAGGNNARLTSSGIEEVQTETNSFNVFPNPSSNKTTVSYSIDHDAAAVQLDLYDHLGRLIKTIDHQKRNAGNYNSDIDFEALNLESGMYIVRLNIDGQTLSDKLFYNK